MMKFHIIAFFAIILFCESQAYVDPLCVQHGQDGACEFYQCFEKNRQCGATGYLTYGYKYCNIYKSFYNKFTQEGKKWVDCFGPCLSRLLIGKYKESVGAGKQCAELTTYALGTKTTCYKECGFCGMYDANKLVLKNIYADKTDPIAVRAYKIVLKAAENCYHG